MHCPRLDHFVRFNSNGSVGCCGHMAGAPEFNSYDELQTSSWLSEIKDEMTRDAWPVECQRCQTTEKISNTSIRLDSIKRDNAFKSLRKDYLIVGGILDNVCNSACQMCNEELSTKIGALKTKKYIKINNINQFWKLPQDRIVHLDINGGEPSASKNYKEILRNLPPNVRSIRVNTNCSLIIDELINVIDKGIHVTVTVSFDGIGPVHDYVRWPIKWDKFYSNLMQYKAMKINNLNLWTTVNALNIADFNNIVAFAKEHKIAHSYALLTYPDPLNVKYTNSLTAPYKNTFLGQVAVDKNNQEELDAYIQEQNQLRGI